MSAEAQETRSSPFELGRLVQWICWRWEERGSRRTKVPYDPRWCANSPDGKLPLFEQGAEIRNADTTDPETWSTRVFAERAVENTRGWARPMDGTGFVFANGYAGVDLDGCRDPTGGAVAGWARAYVERLASYTEVTPSGTGLHVILRGTLAGRGRKLAIPGAPDLAPGRVPTVEVYSAGRYFTVTGDHLAGTPTTVEDRQAELTALEAELPASGPGAAEVTVDEEGEAGLTDEDYRVLAAAQIKHDRLFEFWSEEHLAPLVGAGRRFPSNSEARDSLYQLLTLASRDPTQVWRMFRASAVYRRDPAKARRVRDREIGRALHLTAEQFEYSRMEPLADIDPPRREEEEQRPSRYGILTVGPAIDELRNLPPREDLIDGVWPAGSVGTLIGQSNVGKTTVMLDMVMSILTESDWQGQEVPPSLCGDCAWIAGEGLANLRNLVQGWRDTYPDRPLKHHLHVVPCSLDLPAERHRVAEDIARKSGGRKLVLVVVDTLSKNFGPGNPNDQQDMARFCSALLKLAVDLSAAVVALHHTPWDGERERGSSVLRGDVETTWLLKRDSGSGPIRLSCEKMKGIGMPAREIVISQHEGTIATDDGPQSFQFAICRADEVRPISDRRPPEALASWAGKKMSTPRMRVVDVLAGFLGAPLPQLSYEELGAQTGLSRTALVKHVQGLIEEGYAEKAECSEGEWFDRFQLSELGCECHPVRRLFA